MDRYTPLAQLRSCGHETLVSSFSALDLYFGHKSGQDLFVDTTAGQVELASCFSNISFPGIEIADAFLPSEGEGEPRLWFRCLDSGSSRRAFLPLQLLYDPDRGVFLDREGMYRSLRAGMAEPAAWKADDGETLLEAAILAARYGYKVGGFPAYRGSMSAGQQRLLLSLLLSGKEPGAGMEILAEAGFLDAEWPEVAELRGIDHSKDHHPEGGLWEHTMETFRHRKTLEERLSLGLLLHDSGKPAATSANGRRFDRHAEIGARVARSFLGRLGFPARLGEEVAFLVRHHMLPHALPSLPLYRSQEALESPLFPLLLELYRCDLSATWRGPDGYYEACRAYRQYVKNVRNPYRDAEGKKYMKLVEIGR